MSSILTLWMEFDGTWSCEGNVFPSKDAALESAKRAGYRESSSGPGYVIVIR